MENGFLGNNASLMLDVVVCALVLVVPALLFSLYAVKIQRNYALHKIMQLTLGIVLLVAVSAFEIDMRLHGGWMNIVNKPDQPIHLDGAEMETVKTLLWVHLVFAISTPIFWATTITLALKRFPNPPKPSEHSALHKKLGWISAIDITLTSITGLIFYYFAFIAVPGA
jgi:putative membrane protein